MVETGAKKLTQQYTELVAEGSSGAPPNGPDFMLSSFPPSLKAELLPIVTFLRKLPLPPTHPSHPAAPGIQATLKDAQKGYAHMRGTWGNKCLENYARRVVDRAETIDGVGAGREFGAWVANLLAVAEVWHHEIHWILWLIFHRKSTTSCLPWHLCRVRMSLKRRSPPS